MEDLLHFIRHSVKSLRNASHVLQILVNFYPFHKAYGKVDFQNRLHIYINIHTQTLSAIHSFHISAGF